MKVFVYGGGNIAHALVAAIARYQDVGVVTRRPSDWASSIEYEQSGITRTAAYVVSATADVNRVMDADIVFIALPQFAIEQAVSSLALVMKAGASVILVPAPARTVEYESVLKVRGINLVGIQRVPYIARTLEYGRKVRISDDRAMHKIVSSDKSRQVEISELLRCWFGGEIGYLSSFLTFAFSNSNPLLHPARLVVLFRDWQNREYPTNPLFYAEWTDESSELYIAADAEVRQIMGEYSEIDLSTDYESVLDHYGVSAVPELTTKLRSIPSFKPIVSPMKQLSGKWVPDFDSRYFTEDVPFGTKIIQSYARKVNVLTPTIDRMVNDIIRLRG